jgi:protein-S-isoprenylcysteine O-methyltransferase Ste14
MGIAARATLYATLFVGLVLVLVPTWLLDVSGTGRPPGIGPRQVTGLLVAAAGAAVALACVVTFASRGRGTPAPFDAPRRLVVRGPYRVVRNPMYVGAGLALLGAALFFGSGVLLAYFGALWIASHLFIVGYEEPTLKRRFGGEYDDYRRQVGRWWPKPRRGE